MISVEEMRTLDEFGKELDALIAKLGWIALVPEQEAFRAVCFKLMDAANAVIGALEQMTENATEDEEAEMWELAKVPTPAKPIVKIYLLEQGDDLFICVNQKLVCVRYSDMYASVEIEGRLIWGTIKALQPDVKIEVYTDTIDIIDQAQTANLTDKEMLEELITADPELKLFDLTPLDLGMEVEANV